jgi:hypothetical protein
MFSIIHRRWNVQHGDWHHYQTKQNQADAYRVAQRRAESTEQTPITLWMTMRVCWISWISKLPTVYA